MSATEPGSQATLGGDRNTFGRAAILAYLIIGGGIIVAAILLWHAHKTRANITEAIRIDEIARHELRAAYAQVRAFRPGTALEHTREVRLLLSKLSKELAHDRNMLQMGLLFAEGEALFMLDCGKYAREAEERFDQALNLIPFASGEIWLFGMLGRARTRYESGRYQDALDDLNAIMERNDSHGAAYYWRSLARHALGDSSGAEADEKRARALDSWPPLRDFIPSKCVWMRDILCSPNTRNDGGRAGKLVHLFLDEAGNSGPELNAAE